MRELVVVVRSKWHFSAKLSPIACSQVWMKSTVPARDEFIIVPWSTKPTTIYYWSRGFPRDIPQLCFNRFPHLPRGASSRYGGGHVSGSMLLWSHMWARRYMLRPENPQTWRAGWTGGKPAEVVLETWSGQCRTCLQPAFTLFGVWATRCSVVQKVSGSYSANAVDLFFFFYIFIALFSSFYF